MVEKAPGAKDEAVYDGIKNQGLQIRRMRNANQEIVRLKNDPMLQGINGSLTLSFIIILVVITLGFFIYWIISIQSRELQFGIFRAMGLPVRDIVAMLVAEQVLISVISVLAGIVIGSLASVLFVPLIQLAYGAAEQVPPFKVVSLSGDYIRIYAILGITFGLCSIGLARILSRIKMDRALKLGED
jgi:putative ABC transport system permease protein